MTIPENVWTVGGVWSVAREAWTVKWKIWTVSGERGSGTLKGKFQPLAGLAALSQRFGPLQKGLDS